MIGCGCRYTSMVCSIDWCDYVDRFYCLDGKMMRDRRSMLLKHHPQKEGMYAREGMWLSSSSSGSGVYETAYRRDEERSTIHTYMQYRYEDNNNNNLMHSYEYYTCLQLERGPWCCQFHHRSSAVRHQEDVFGSFISIYLPSFLESPLMAASALASDETTMSSSYSLPAFIHHYARRCAVLEEREGERKKIERESAYVRKMVK